MMDSIRSVRPDLYRDTFGVGDVVKDRIGGGLQRRPWVDRGPCFYFDDRRAISMVVKGYPVGGPREVQGF